MRSSLLCMVVAVGAAGLGGRAMAEMLKVGAIDTPRLLREAPQTQIVLLKIEQEQAPRRRSIAASRDELRRSTETLERDGAVMSAANRDALERDIRELRRKLEREQTMFDESIAIRRYEDFARLQADLVREAREIAAHAGYDVVLPNALYASPAVDITDLVLRELQARYATPSLGPSQSDRSWGAPPTQPRASLR